MRLSGWCPLGFQCLASDFATFSPPSTGGGFQKPMVGLPLTVGTWMMGLVSRLRWIMSEHGESRIRDFDVIIVGAGPAGIFAALELSGASDLDVLLLEKGCNLAERHCLARDTGRCINCRPCDITSGWGGAGAYSDGKLTLSPRVGGWLGEYISADRLSGLIGEVDGLYRRFGAPEAVSYTHLRAHETKANLVCRLLREKKKKNKTKLYT